MRLSAADGCTKQFKLEVPGAFTVWVACSWQEKWGKNINKLTYEETTKGLGLTRTSPGVRDFRRHSWHTQTMSYHQHPVRGNGRQLIPGVKWVKWRSVERNNIVSKSQQASRTTVLLEVWTPTFGWAKYDQFNDHITTVRACVRSEFQWFWPRSLQQMRSSSQLKHHHLQGSCSDSGRKTTTWQAPGSSWNLQDFEVLTTAAYKDSWLGEKMLPLVGPATSKVCLELWGWGFLSPLPCRSGLCGDTLPMNSPLFLR